MHHHPGKAKQQKNHRNFTVPDRKSQVETQNFASKGEHYHEYFHKSQTPGTPPEALHHHDMYCL